MSLSSTAYVYDGSLEGLLTCIFMAYANHEHPDDVATESELQPRLDQFVRTIETDTALATRVHDGICRTCGPAGFAAVRSASLSSNPNRGSIIYRFVRYAMKENRPHNCAGCNKQGSCLGTGTDRLNTCPKAHQRSIMSDIANPTVGNLHALVKEVANEAERMRQFIRFQHMENGVWFAQCNPKASVVPVVMPHFAARFNTQPFIIFDENHHLAGVSERGSWHLVQTDSITLPNHAAEEAAMQEAWKRFYKAVSIESRYNPELRRQFMPKRLWKNITEMQETICSKPQRYTPS